MLAAADRDAEIPRRLSDQVVVSAADGNVEA